MRFGYTRVSTSDQVSDHQHDALIAAGVDADRIYADVGSGARFDRPGLQSLLKALRPGDQLVVGSLDRIGRSTKNLLATVDELSRRGIEFVSLRENIDTSTATGKLTLTIFAAIAAFERELLVERTRAGIGAARARGRNGGRPRSLKPADVRLARTMLADRQVTVTEVAAHFQIGRTTLYRALNRENAK